MQHDILKFQISMDYENVHHIVEAIDQLIHNPLNHLWRYSPVASFHKFFQITAVAKLHENVISGICFYSFSHSSDILTRDCILILNLRNDQALFGLTKIGSFHYFASVELGVGRRFKSCKWILSFCEGVTSTSGVRHSA
jgi:hypothetical protein